MAKRLVVTMANKGLRCVAEYEAKNIHYAQLYGFKILILNWNGAPFCKITWND